MIDVRQSPEFAAFMESLGWKTKLFCGSNVYLRKFPLMGSFAKMPRYTKPLKFEGLNEFLKENTIFTMKVAPFMHLDEKKAEKIRQELFAHGFQTEVSPFNPTTTLQFDLTQDEQKIFNNFSEAKRRAVRRAIKNDIEVRESDDIEAFVKIRKYQYRPMGFLMSGETRAIWRIFAPKYAKLVLAYQKGNPTALSGIFLLIYDKVAYYWFASSFDLGKKLFAPSILVWEALKIAKKRGCTMFDFEGIYDERFPEAGKTWKGFTKFKEGFGARKVLLVENFVLKKKRL